VALGASAARSLVGKPVTIGAVRDRLLETDADLGKIPVLVTIHPSYVLRMSDSATRKAQLARLVADLRRARAATSSRATASR
jgi:DNA polymerase